jgi:hypothetical protein
MKATRGIQQIGILVSTAPLRKTASFRGRTEQRFNMESVVQLASRFDLIIVGSLSADEVFQYIEQHLPPRLKSKFRFYPRSFFHQFKTDEIMRTTDDPRNPAWEKILGEHGIRFEVLRSVIGEDHRHHQKKFTWDTMTDFILDDRVTLVTGSEGNLLYEKVKASSRL